MYNVNNIIITPQPTCSGLGIIQINNMKKKLDGYLMPCCIIMLFLLLYSHSTAPHSTHVVSIEKKTGCHCYKIYSTQKEQEHLVLQHSLAAEERNFALKGGYFYKIGFSRNDLPRSRSEILIFLFI